MTETTPLEVLDDGTTMNSETGEIIAAPKTKSNGKGAKKKTKASVTKKAGDAIADAAIRGDVRAAKRIGRTLIALERAVEDLRECRKDFKGRLDVAEARFRGSVQADDDGTDAGAREKLTEIVEAFQDREELQAHRKSELSLKLESAKELKAKLKKQVEGARQLGLFDDD